MNDAYYKFVDKAKEFACGIYQQVPGALVPNPSDAGYKQIWDKLCYTPPPAPPGLPPPPKPDFPGGQCKFFYFIEYKDRSDTLRDTRLTGEQCQGTIKSITGREENDGFYFYVACPDARNGELVSPGVYKFRVPNTSGAFPTTFVSWIPQPKDNFGNPVSDTCGDPPKKYPPAPPPPPGGYTSPPTLIPDNDGDISNEYIFNFFPPQKIDFPDVPFPPIVINVRGDNVNLDFDINFNFDGDIDFTRPGGREDLSPALAGGFQDLGSGLAGVSGKVGSLRDDFGDFTDVLDGVTDNLDGIGSSLNNLAGKLDFKFTPPLFIDAPEVEKEEIQVEGGGQEDEDKPGLLGILVVLTVPATDVIFGTPNVHFAGWLTFLSQGGYQPREPIHFEKSYFPAPEGATGYALTFTKGAKGTITVFSESDSD